MSVPSFSARLLEKAIVELQNSIARIPWTVPRVLSFTEYTSSLVEEFRLRADRPRPVPLKTFWRVRLVCEKSFFIA